MRVSVFVSVCGFVFLQASDLFPMALQAGRLKVVESHASVYVRVCDAQRMGSVEGPANEAGAQPFLRVPPYVQEGSRVQYDMQTVKTGGRTYDNARRVLYAGSLTWLCLSNSSIIVLVKTGLQQQQPQITHAHQLQPHLHSVSTK